MITVTASVIKLLDSLKIRTQLNDHVPQKTKHKNTKLQARYLLLQQRQKTTSTEINYFNTMNEGVVSEETVVLRRWGSSIQKFGFINGVDNVNWPPYRDSKS